MIRFTTIAILLQCVFLSVAGQNLYQVTQSTVTFTSDAPLELIEAKSTKAQGVIKDADNSFVFRVPMKAFRGFNSDLQRTHFNTNYLETDQYPYTIFQGKIIEDVSFLAPGTYDVRGKGRFTCHGVERERIIRCKLTISNNNITVQSKFSVYLEDHDISIPTVVNQKIAEEIFVDVQFELQKK